MIKVLALNTGSNLITLVVRLAITFVITPVLLANLGRYDYGLWEMLAAVVGYAGMLGFGVRPAVSRFAALHKAREDQESLQLVYSCAFFLMAAAAFVLFLVFTLFAFWFPDLLAPRDESARRYTLLLLILGAQLLIEFPGYVAESYLEGFQRYYLKNNVTIVNSVIGSTVLYHFITPTNGLLLLAGVNAVGITLKYLVFLWILSRPSMGRLLPSGRKFSVAKTKELLVFAGKSMVQGISTRIENQTDALVIGAFLGPAMVPLYSIPANLTHYLRTIGWTLTHAFLPLFSDLHARGDKDQPRQIYLMASKYVVGVLLPMAAGMALVGEPFLILWIGPEIAAHADMILAMLAAFTVAPLLNPFASRYLTAIDQHAVFAKVTPVSASVNLGLSLVLVQTMGIIGVALASLIAVAFTVPIYLHTACRFLGITKFHYVSVSLLPAIIPTLAMVVVVLGYRRSLGIDSYPELIGAVAAGAIVYFAFFWILACNSNERRVLAARIIPQVLGRVPR